MLKFFTILLLAASTGGLIGCGKNRAAKSEKPGDPPAKEGHVVESVAGTDTNMIAEIVRRLVEQPRKEPMTNMVSEVQPGAGIAGDPREKVMEAMELVVKHADRELALLTRERHELELRLRETDSAVKDAFSSFVQSRDQYYKVLEGNSEYRKAMEKELEAYAKLTNVMARLDAIKEGSRKK